MVVPPSVAVAAVAAAAATAVAVPAVGTTATTITAIAMATGTGTAQIVARTVAEGPKMPIVTRRHLRSQTQPKNQILVQQLSLLPPLTLTRTTIILEQPE